VQRFILSSNLRCVSVSKGVEIVKEAPGPARLAYSVVCARIGCIVVSVCHGDDHLGSLAVLLWRICNVRGSAGTFDGRCIAQQRGLNDAQASGELRCMHATRYQRIFVCHPLGNAAEALRQNEPDFRSARLTALSFESCHTGSERAHQRRVQTAHSTNRSFCVDRRCGARVRWRIAPRPRKSNRGRDALPRSLPVRGRRFSRNCRSRT
jgi:hypothetical protein